MAILIKKVNGFKILLIIFLLLVALSIGILISSFFVFSISKHLEYLFQLQTIKNSLLSDHRHQMLCGAITGLFFIIFCYVVFWKRTIIPHNHLIRITPEISIPAPAGQYQYGSARFATDQEISRYFNSIILNRRNPYLLTLIKEGKSDFKAIQAGIVRPAFVLPGKPLMLHAGLPVSYKRLTGYKECVHTIYGDKHTLCFGATRSGKTRTIVLQSICLQALSGFDICSSDPKGELYQYTYPFVRRLGYADIPIDFKNPRKSARYNFLQFVIEALKEGDITKAIQSCWDIVDGLVKDSPHGDPMWPAGEKGLLAAGIMQVVYDNSELGLSMQYPEATPNEIHELYETKHKFYQNCINLYRYISNMTVQNPATGNLFLEDIIAVLPEQHPSKLILSLAESAPPKTRGSFITMALTTLRLFTDPNIADMTSSTDPRLLDFGTKKAIYIILPDNKQTHYPLASLFVSQYYQYLADYADVRGGKLERYFEYNLDEFGNFSRLNFFEGQMTVAAGRGIHFHLYLQSKDQLSEKYGQNIANIIMDNCENWIYLKANSMETLKLIESKLGNYTAESSSLSASQNDRGLNLQINGSTAVSTQLIGRPLLQAPEIGRLERPFLLVLTKGYPCITQMPDLHKWQFNDMLGMGSVEHNTKLRELREGARSKRDIPPYNLWDFQSYFNRLIAAQKTKREDETLSYIRKNLNDYADSF